MAREDSQLLMEDMKFFIIVKSQLVPCVVCALTRPHKMRYQLLRCSSETCKAATPYDACPWMGKVMTCQELNRVTIMEAGAHETLVRDPRKPKMTPRLKDYGREMATQGLKPARIRMGMARRFGLSETDLPTLNQVQWFIAAFTKAKLHRNDDYDDILGQIDALLVDITPSRSSIEFLLVSPNPNLVRVLSRGCVRVYLPELGRSRETAPVSAQMGSNYARMELEGQPESGWEVDVSKLSCECKYNFKFALCIHVLFALQLKNYTGLDGKRTLVNRSVSKMRRRTGSTVGEAIKRLTKARLIEAAAKGDDAGEAEWVLDAGIDLSGRPTYQMDTILDDRKENGRVVFLTKWEPTWEPASNLPSGEIKKYRQRKRRKVEKTYIEAEAVEE
ncbi:hypothetical protein PF003_g8080 [Phytophthora fragariae]|nr:hypothetical protein PF003_g8080 [Phytophthora fragariae]